MSYFNEFKFSDDQITKSVAGNLRVSQLTTLFDGKVLNTNSTFIWQNTGSGTPTFQSNKLNMAVSAGQYFIRQSKDEFVLAYMPTTTNQSVNGVINFKEYF